MTMAKLAELAGVSISTVSKAFSGSSEISENKREKIFDIAKEYGCYDKYCKDVYKDTVIAVICQEYKSGLYSEQLSLLDKEIKKRNGLMITGCIDFNNERFDELLTFFAEYSKVDGIILLHTPKTEKKYSVPIVVLGDSDNFDCVTLLGEGAVTQAVSYLKQNGHQKISFIGEPLTKEKQLQFVKAMNSIGLKIEDKYILTVESRFEECGYNAMNKLLELEEPPTAVVTAYDDIAFGAMKSINEHGLKIPEDISIIGFDDNRNSSYLDLTTITEYNEDLCQILTDLIFERIKKPGIKKTIKISKDLVIRDSVGKVNTK